MAVTAAAPVLTDADRSIIARARALADAATTDDLRAVAGSDPDSDWLLVRAEALGVAKFLLVELAVIAERLGNGG